VVRGIGSGALVIAVSEPIKGVNSLLSPRSLFPVNFLLLTVNCSLILNP
jgi:hypothetical protein